MTKSIRKLLKYIRPEADSQLALKHTVDPNFGFNNLDRVEKNVPYALMEAFAWDRTPEGYGYWQEVYKYPFNPKLRRNYTKQ
jgi:hypothetical protein